MGSRIRKDIMIRLIPQMIMYQGTITGLRISAVDGGATESGGAFIDGANASVTALADGNHQIEIYDSAGRMIKGVLKAAGSAETLDSEQVTGWSAIAGYEPDTLTVNANGHDVDVFIEASASDSRCEATPLQTVLGRLLKIVSDIVINSGTMSVLRYSTLALHGGTYIVKDIASAITTSKTITDYINTSSVDPLYCLGYRTAGANVNCSFTFSLKQVLTPSSSGSTIVSAKGGVTYNWAYKNAAFAYNEANYRVVVRRLR